MRDVEFQLASGQIALLSGLNGCGKTTLLNILSGFLRPDQGQVILKRCGEENNLLGKSPEQLDFLKTLGDFDHRKVDVTDYYNAFYLHTRIQFYLNARIF